MVQQDHCLGPKLERKQEGRRKAKRMKGIGGNSSKITGAETDNAMTPSMAEEARNATLADNNRAHSNRGSREDKYGDSMTTAKNRVGITQSIYYENK